MPELLPRQYSPLYKRDCVTCSGTPSCSSCDDGYECVLTVQTCDSCPEAQCQAVASAPSSSASASAGGGSHVNAGAIAGGVVGGLVALAIILAAILWKCVYSKSARQRRLAKQGAFGDADITPNVDAEAGFFEKQRARDSQYTKRMSTGTVSTVVTRGSNVIPIAYIPGVTNRSTEEVPPMPTEQFFSASDLMRQSQLSQDGIRSSIATTSYRGSIAFPDTVGVTAIQGKPYLVDVTNDDSTALYGPPTPTGTGPVLTESATVASIQRGTAHSIRVGGGKNPVGLQTHMIEEEPEEERSSRPASASRSASNPAGTQILAGHASDPSQAAPPQPGDISRTSSAPNLRYSVTSDFEVPFVIYSGENQASTASPAARRSASTRASSASNMSRSTRNSRSSRFSRSSRRITGYDRESQEYIIEDLPIEAYLIAKGRLSEIGRDDDATNGHHSHNSRGSNGSNGSNNGSQPSPFDDRFREPR